jgi:hypothetical protein
MDASDFSNPTLQRKIPGPNDPPLDGEVVGAVNLSRDDTELYVTEWNSKQSFFAKFNRATGAKKCVSMPENIQMWSSPTAEYSVDAVFIAGGSGNIWRFSTVTCLLEMGWPVFTQGNATITGPVLVYKHQVIAAAQDGHVAMFNYDNPQSPAPGFDVHMLVDPMIPNKSPLQQGWDIVGSPALATVTDKNGTTKTLLLLSISAKTGDAGALVGVDVGALGVPTFAGMFQTPGPLEAGPSVGFLGNGSLTTIAVVPELNLIVHGIQIDSMSPFDNMSPSWTAKFVGQVPQGDQFTTEASVTNGNVFLTSPSRLIGLELKSGLAKWPPVHLTNSPQAPAVADNGNIYLAAGSSIEAYSSSTGKMIIATMPTQGIFSSTARPSIAKDGSVLVSDSLKNILEFR